MAKKRRVARKRKSVRRKVKRKSVRSSQGVSRKTLAVMLVLVIAVSVLGTWMMLNAGMKMQQASSQTYGTITFNILPSGTTVPTTIV